MTEAQKLEVRRMTPSMWELLRYAKRMDGLGADIDGGWMRSANILARRGFCTLQKPRPRAFTKITLTDAGREAIAMSHRR